jgi:hypothetical protein
MQHRLTYHVVPDEEAEHDIDHEGLCRCRPTRQVNSYGLPYLLHRPMVRYLHALPPVLGPAESSSRPDSRLAAVGYGRRTA